ncbi:MAG TPA: flagellar motor protein [Gammaproteobacteria bacterium]|nr:flagellar motor protein [Gammaproteobacteria bacterium]
MDALSITGVLLALVAILVGQSLEGGHVASLLNGPAALIVLGGTLGASMLQTPLKVFSQAMRSIVLVFRPPTLDAEQTIKKIVGWSTISRQQGLLGLESIGEAERNPFTRRGLRMLVDGSEPEVIRAVLETEMEAREHQELQAARVFEGMGGYAPTIGILGAVMGLIHVMENLSEPDKLGPGIAVAFVATIYGVALANLLLLPVANKLKSIAHARASLREMIIEGIVSIAQGENPRSIELRLQSYLH